MTVLVVVVLALNVACSLVLVARQVGETHRANRELLDELRHAREDARADRNRLLTAALASNSTDFARMEHSEKVADAAAGYFEDRKGRAQQGDGYYNEAGEPVVPIGMGG